MALISVIMPAYNVEDFISKAVESVLAQSFTDWELLIIDDGSIDNTGIIAESYIGRDKRIKVYHKTNGGLSDARNFGLERAQGEYVHFFDSDDWIEESFYKELVNDIKLNADSDLLISGYKIDTIRNNGILKCGTKNILKTWTNPNELVSFMSGYFNFAWNKLFKINSLKSNEIFFEKGLSLIEDCEFISRFVEIKPKISFSASTGYHYRNDTRNTLSRQFRTASIELSGRRIECSKRIVKYLNNKDWDFEVIELIKFNTIRYLLHSLFSFENIKNREYQLENIELILKSEQLKLDTLPLALQRYEKILWWTYKNNLKYLTYIIYKIIK